MDNIDALNLLRDFINNGMSYIPPEVEQAWNKLELWITELENNIMDFKSHQ